jgi:hypothetical protein
MYRYTNILTIMVFEKKDPALKMVKICITLRRDAHDVLREQSKVQDRPMSEILTDLVLAKYPKQWYHGARR